jgi:hypothetical protein
MGINNKLREKGKVQMDVFIPSMRSLFTVHGRKHVIQRGCMKEVGQTTTI